MKHNFKIVGSCPCPERIAPYIVLCLQGAAANSIYRGSDAEKLLNAHGHQSQAQLYQGWIEHRPGYLPANPPGFSTHELKSDGVVYPQIQRGHDLEWWMQGFDVDDSLVPAIQGHAAHRGWELYRPYSTGSEYHHLNFRHEPVPTGKGGATKARIYEVRGSLPTS